MEDFNIFTRLSVRTIHRYSRQIGQEPRRVHEIQQGGRRKISSSFGEFCSSLSPRVQACTNSRAPQRDFRRGQAAADCSPLASYDPSYEHPTMACRLIRCRHETFPPGYSLNHFMNVPMCVRHEPTKLLHVAIVRSVTSRRLSTVHRHFMLGKRRRIDIERRRTKNLASG